MTSSGRRKGMALVSKLCVRVAALLAALLLLSACSGEKTPQDVTALFWQAVIGSDANKAVEYSTLTDARAYDGFSRDWKGLQPTLGKLVIEGDEASVVTTFAGPDTQASGRPLEVVTYLVRQNDQWKVDYGRTGEALRGPLASLFTQFNRLSKKISDQLDAAAGDLTVEMERLSEQLEQLSATVSEQTSTAIEQYGKALRRSIDELAESVERALKDQRLTDQDKRTLRRVAKDLNEDSDNLARPTAEVIADSGKNVAAARQQLAGTESASLQPYKEQWQKWGERIEADVRRLVDELSAARSKGSRERM
ncbi:MAG TPA: hypothetical protein VFY81_11975 [Gammaproteobacteria bacterium]|nr:hypothetical protein [Gammaproteobacteria bacterium]